MSLLTRIFSLRRAWPPRPIDLLLRACVLPENEARAAWRTWTQETRFDDMTWPEIRLVAFLSGRIAILDPGSPLLPRVEGLGRAHWTRNQAKLRGLIQLHDALGREGIDALIFKGAAAHLEGMGALRRRVLGDVDILVRPHEMARALDVAIADGWRCVTGESPEILRVLMNRLRALNFRKDAYAEIDLHRYAFQVAANDVDEEDLWTDARRVTALERTLTVPSPAHSLVIGLTHGSSTQGGDWVLDAIARLHGPAFDWGSVVAATRRHLVVPNVRAGLLYLRECLAQDVPRSVLDELASERVAVALHLRFWAGARQSRSRRPIERVLRRAARRALRRAGYRVASGYRSSVQVMRPSTAWQIGRAHV